MSRWHERVEELLHKGESIEDRFDLDPAEVIVTNQRLLAFTPDRDGEEFHQIDRPNVLEIEPGHAGDRSALWRALKYGVVGLILLLAGLLFDIEQRLGEPGLLDADGAARFGGSGLLDAMNMILTIFFMLDDLLVLAGLGGIILGLALIAYYLHFQHEPALVISVAGDDDDVYLPHPDDEALLAELKAAVTISSDSPQEDLPDSGAGDAASSERSAEGFVSDTSHDSDDGTPRAPGGNTDESR